MQKYLKNLKLICSMVVIICIFQGEIVLANDTTTNSKSEGVNKLTEEKISRSSTIGYVLTNGATLNVRKTASTSSTVLGKLNNGTKVEIIDKSISGWYKIKYGSSYGYVSKDYISFTAPSVASKWVYPMKNYVINQKFNNKYTNGKYHLGIDIKASDKSILAAADGVVTSAKYTGSNANGNCIVIEHTLNNGKKVYSVYAHLDSMAVKSGTKVKAGQKIGVMGNTGNSTGPHLHFAILDSKSENPLGYGTSAAVNGVAVAGGRKFYDPIKFIRSNGSMITGSTSTTPTTVKVTGVSLNTTSTSITVGNTVTLTATVAPSNATNKQVTWKSSNTAVATVDANGKVKGIKAGSANITVTTKDGSKVATCKVTVNNVNQSVTIGYVSTNGANLNVRKTASTSSTSLGKLSNGTKVEIVDKSIANWYKIKYGTGYGYVSKDFIKLNATSTPTTVKVTGVSLNKTSTSITVGNTVTLTATVAPSNATNKQVTWKSSNTAVATVDANGKVKGIKAGSANITVTTKDGAKVATCKVTVNNVAQSVTIGYVSTNGANLNVRKTASTSSTSLGKLSNGAKVEIVDKSIANWYKIKYGTGYGYVSKNYISLNITTVSNMKVSNNLVEFIKGYEGFRSKPYRDAAGHLTIGYGHLIKSGEKFTTLTKAQATELLKKDIAQFEAKVNLLCKGIKLKQNEFDSLVSFAYNLGAGKLQQSNLLVYIKSGGRDATKIKNEYMKYVRANGKVLRGLQNRRYSEWRMFSYGEYKRVEKY